MGVKALADRISRRTLGKPLPPFEDVPVEEVEEWIRTLIKKEINHELADAFYALAKVLLKRKEDT